MAILYEMSRLLRLSHLPHLEMALQASPAAKPIWKIRSLTNVTTKQKLPSMVDVRTLLRSPKGSVILQTDDFSGERQHRDNVSLMGLGGPGGLRRPAHGCRRKLD